MRVWIQILSLILMLAIVGCAPKQPQQPSMPSQEEVATQPAEPEPTTTAPEPDPAPTSQPEEAPQPEPKPEPVAAKPAMPEIGDMLVIGEAEFIYVREAKMKLRARIDTGATTSSISAINIKRFERDGKKWVRFVIPLKDGKTSQLIERPITRIAEIKRHGAESMERPVVTLQVSIGSIKTKSEFSLTDRSAFEYPVLIGRTFLSGRAVVDVSQKYVTSPMGQ